MAYDAFHAERKVPVFIQTHPLSTLGHVCVAVGKKTLMLCSISSAASGVYDGYEQHGKSSLCNYSPDYQLPRLRRRLRRVWGGWSVLEVLRI